MAQLELDKDELEPETPKAGKAGKAGKKLGQQKVQKEPRQTATAKKAAPKRSLELWQKIKGGKERTRAESPRSPSKSEKNAEVKGKPVDQASFLDIAILIGGTVVALAFLVAVILL